MIPERDLLAFNKALLELYSPGLDLDNYTQRAFCFLSSFAEAELMVFGTRGIGGPDAKVGILVDRILPGLEEVVVPFGRMAAKYRFLCGDTSGDSARPFFRSDFYTDREYRSLDIHAEVFRRWNHENFMTMVLEIEENQVIFFGSSRGKNDYSGKERLLTEYAQPHLLRARQHAIALSAAKPWVVSPELFVHAGFTPRESDVLYWLTEGKSNVEIATILHIGIPTVKGYLTSLFNKTGTSSRLAVTLHGLEIAKRQYLSRSLYPSGPLLFTAPFKTTPTKVG